MHRRTNSFWNVLCKYTHQNVLLDFLNGSLFTVNVNLKQMVPHFIWNIHMLTNWTCSSNWNVLCENKSFCSINVLYFYFYWRRNWKSNLFIVCSRYFELPEFAMKLFNAVLCFVVSSTGAYSSFSWYMSTVCFWEVLPLHKTSLDFSLAQWLLLFGQLQFVISFFKLSITN